MMPPVRYVRDEPRCVIAGCALRFYRMFADANGRLQFIPPGRAIIPARLPLVLNHATGLELGEVDAWETEEGICFAGCFEDPQRDLMDLLIPLWPKVRGMSIACKGRRVIHIGLCVSMTPRCPGTWATLAVGARNLQEARRRRA